MADEQIQVSTGDHSPNIQSKRDTYINSTIVGLSRKWLIIFLLSIIVIMGFILYWMSPKEILEIPNVKRIDVAITEIQSSPVSGLIEPGGTGLVAVHWELLLSNNGDRDLSIIDYKVRQVRDENFLPIYYSGMDQGLYWIQEDELVPVDLPITISAGSTVAVFFRAGILLDPNVYELIKQKFNEGTIINLKDLTDYIYSNEVDFYGNKVEVLSLAPNSFSFPSFGEAKEQIFLVSFETARGSKVEEKVSWYTYGIMRTLLGTIDE